MSILSTPAHRRQETDMGPALRRLKRFAVVGLVMIGALYMVLAVKAQVAPAPHVWDQWPGYERYR